MKFTDKSHLVIQLTIMVLALMGLMFLSGCSDKSKVIKPNKLVDYNQKAKAELKWYVDSGDGNEGQYLQMGPTLKNKVVYTVNFKGTVTAIQATEGRIIWQKDLQADLSASPAISGEFVFAGGVDGYLYALDKKSGKKKWQVQLASSLYAQPALYKDYLVVLTHDGTVQSYDKKTGDLLWQYRVPTPSLTLLGNAAPTIFNQQVLAGMANGELWAFELDSGQPEWNRVITKSQGNSEVSGMVDILTQPVIYQNKIYVGSYQGNIVAINTNSLNKVWQKPYPTYHNFAYDKQRLYATRSNSFIAAFNHLNGQKQWENKQLRGRSVTQPELIGDYIAVGDNQGYIHFFDKQNGQYIERIRVDDVSINAQLASNGQTLFVQTANGWVAAISITSVAQTK